MVPKWPDRPLQQAVRGPRNLSSGDMVKMGDCLRQWDASLSL